MKVKSYIKAILSGIVWGLGQLFNKQFLKAFFFFAIFVLFVGVELGTSNYFYNENYENELAYSKINGNDFGDTWFQEFPTMYQSFLKQNPSEASKIKSESFEKYLEDLGVTFVNIGGNVITRNKELFTEQKAIEYFAQEFKESSPINYTNIFDSSDVVLEADFDTTGYKHLITRGTIYIDESNNTFYFERENDVKEKEYVQTNLFTDDLIENPIILNNNEGLTRIQKYNEHYTYNNELYIRVDYYSLGEDLKEVKQTKYIKLNSENKLIYFNEETSQLTKKTILGPIYSNSVNMYEYYEPALLYNGTRLQYKEPTIMLAFKYAVGRTYGSTIVGNQYSVADYERLMLKIYFELNPEVKEDYVNQYDNFFNDRAGMFVKGYWSIFTLGSAKKQNFTSYMALSDAMVGVRGSDQNLLGYIQLVGSIPIQGHISTMLLIEGLIAMLLSLFFLIFMIWSILDAYRVAEQKRLQEEVLTTKKYFKKVWDNGFEYIVLSPAMFVLAFISIMPILFGFILAFTSISGNQSMVENFNYVGLRNFLAIFDFSSGLGASFGRAFWSVLWWTIIWAVLSTATVFFGGFIQALILNSEKVVFRKLWRTILILPWAIPALLSQMVFSVMFKETGFINQLLSNVGIYDLLRNIGILGKPYSEMSGFLKNFWLGEANIQWFTNSFNISFVRGTLIVLNIWLGFPYFMALMTGIMTAIDKNLYEAADIDGATGIQKIGKITIPLVMYSTAPILIMTFSGNFNNFGVIYFITGGGPNAGLASRGYAGSTDILISWMYSLTTDHAIYNMASVFSVLIFLFVGSVTAWNLSRTRAFQED